MAKDMDFDTARETIREKADDLAAEIAALRKDMEAIAGTVSKMGRAGMNDARKIAETRYKDGKAYVDAFETRIVDEARTRPWRTLGIAALGGLLVGLFFRR